MTRRVRAQRGERIAQMTWAAAGRCSRAFLALVACLVLVPGTGAQQDSPVFSIAATFGWNGVVPGDRWTPITVHITAGDRPESGTLLVEFAQDPTQMARIAAPFAATPNRTTPVQVIASIPDGCERVTITAVAEDGRIRRLVHSSGLTRDEIPLPSILDEDTGVVLVLGRSPLPESIADWTAGPRVLDPAWGRLVGARADPEWLPSSSPAYEGLLAMVAPGDLGAGVEPRALEAVHEWVRGGGRLVVIADGPGEAWRAWLPEEARGFISADPPAAHPLPAGAAKAIEAFRADLRDPDRAKARRRVEERRRRGGRLPDYPPDPSNQNTQPQEIAGPAERISGRQFRLKEPAIRHGWEAQWSDDQQSGMLVEGPVGFGHVTLLGVDPSKTTEVVSVRAAGAAWRAALSPAIADFLADRTADDRPIWGRSQSQGRQAINSTLERLSNVPIVGGWVAALLGAGLLVLVALIGPVDYFVLRRARAMQHWWLTALAWTALACAGAYAAPKLIRTHPTQVNRLTVVDHLSPGHGGTPLAISTGVTAVYAGRSGIVRPRVDPASWWRGTSAVFYRYGGEVNTPGVAPTRQEAAGGAAGSRRGNPLQPLPMALWTFRTFIDQSRVEPTAAALVRRTAEGCSVMVTGMPEGCRVTSAVVEIQTDSFAANASGPGGSVGNVERGTWRCDAPKVGADIRWGRPGIEVGQGADGILAFSPGAALSLPGPDRRHMAASRLVKSGRWAMVMLEVEGWPGEPLLDRAAKYEHVRVMRLLAPLEDGGIEGGAESEP